MRCRGVSNSHRPRYVVSAARQASLLRPPRRMVSSTTIGGPSQRYLISGELARVESYPTCPRVRIRVVDVRRSGNPGSGSLPAGCRRPIRLLGLCAHRTEYRKRLRNRLLAGAETGRCQPLEPQVVAWHPLSACGPTSLDLRRCRSTVSVSTLRITVRPCRPELPINVGTTSAPNGGRESRRDVPGMQQRLVRAAHCAERAPR